MEQPDPAVTFSDRHFLQLRKIFEMRRAASDSWSRDFFTRQWQGAVEAREWAAEQLERYTLFQVEHTSRRLTYPRLADVVKVIDDLTRFLEEPK